jgi:hypothetical protein
MPRTKRISAISMSSPGRTRTVDPLVVSQLPSPLGHRTINRREAGGWRLEYLATALRLQPHAYSLTPTASRLQPVPWVTDRN